MCSRQDSCSEISSFLPIGEATTGREVIALAASLQPDIILMDLNLPELNGIEATRSTLSTFPQIKILVLTMFEDDDSVVARYKAVTAA